MNSAVILSPITMGYGSPQYLYMYDLLAQCGYRPLLLERHEAQRPFRPIAGYRRALLRPGWRGRATLWRQLAQPALRLFVTGADVRLPAPLAALVERRARVLRYALELEDNFDRQARSYPPAGPRLTAPPRPTGWLRPLRYDALIAPEERRLELVGALYPAVRRRFLVYNAAPRALPGRVRALPAGRPVVLYQGQLNWLTCLDLLLETIERTHERFAYVVAGPCADADGRARLEALAARGLIDYHGSLPMAALERLRDEAHIGLVLWRPVLLATQYACPNKLYEYLAAGLPVVCTPNASLVRWNERFGCGETMGELSAAALAAALTRMAADPARYTARSAHVRELHQRELNWEAQTEELSAYLAAA